YLRHDSLLLAAFPGRRKTLCRMDFHAGHHRHHLWSSRRLSPAKLEENSGLFFRHPLGVLVLGIFAFNNISMQGAVYQMLAHGISAGALFLLVGMLYDRRHTFEISEYGGLATPMPKLAAFFLVAALASMGLPMLNGFVGEYLVLLGTYQSHWAWASWAALGGTACTAYLFPTYQRVLCGDVTATW